MDTYVSVVVLDDDRTVIAAGICDCQEAVNEWLRTFVRKWWLKEIGTPPPDPITNGDMEQYFNATMESYSISGPLLLTTMENVND